MAAAKREAHMQSFRLLVAGILVSSTLSCAAMDNPWGKGAIGGAVAGAAAGGISGGVAANQDAFGDADDGTRAAGIGVGMVGGAAVGALLGHLLFDEAPAPVAVAAAPPPPPPAPAPLAVLTGTSFAFDSAALAPAAERHLEGTIEAMQTDSTLRVRIDGYTDSTGSEAYNMRLSQRRADTVKAYLVDHGIEAMRLQTRGLGPSNPVASNSTEEGRARNRRVEVHRLP